jgi:hypothetical protein
LLGKIDPILITSLCYNSYYGTRRPVMTTFKVFADLRHKDVWPEEQMAMELAKICKSAGYDCERLTEQAEYEPIPASEIHRKQKGYVGIAGGEQGFRNMTAEDLKKGKFEYSGIKPDRKLSSKWAPLEWFKALYNSKVDRIEPQSGWPSAEIPRDMVYEHP